MATRTARKIHSATAGGGPAHLDTVRMLRIVIRAAQRHSGWIEKRCGVSGAHLSVMQELLEGPGMRVGEVASALAIHQTTASNLLESLEKRGYIVKSRDAADLRVVRVALSAAGAELLRHAPAPARSMLPEALRKLDRQALMQIDTGLRALLAAIGAGDESQGLHLLPLPI